MDEALPKTEHPLYLQAKKEAMETAKPFPILAACFVESLALALESSPEISGGRAIELMEYVIHLLKCRRVCFRHKLMREVMELD